MGQGIFGISVLIMLNLKRILSFFLLVETVRNTRIRGGGTQRLLDVVVASLTGSPGDYGSRAGE